MPDIATLAAFLGSIKTATEIAKVIRLSDSSLEKAELKLKIAELMETLADVKIQAIEIQELIQEKDKRIKELEESLIKKSKLIRHKNHYYEIDENGNPAGDPYCSHCFESKGKGIHLNKIGGLKVCPACESVSTH